MKQKSLATGIVRSFGRVVQIDETGDYFLMCYALPSEEFLDERAHTLYSLTSIFDAHSRGVMAQEFPDLTSKDLRLCSAFLATNVPHHPAYIKNNRGKRVKILFDENLPYGLVSALTEELPNLSHVYLEGMEGFTDEFIYQRPWYHLKEKSPYERRKSSGTKHIIITRDMDLTDLARAQWTKRLSSCATPEDIKFHDVNVVFRVVDESFTNVENVQRFKDLAKDIMKAAYGSQSASYTISKSGVYIERGSSLEDLIHNLDNQNVLTKLRNGLLSDDERHQGRSHRYNGRYDEIVLEMSRRTLALEAA